MEQELTDRMVGRKVCHVSALEFGKVGKREARAIMEGIQGKNRRLISTILLGCLLLIMLGISSFLFLDSGKTEGLAAAGLAFGLVALVGG